MNGIAAYGLLAHGLIFGALAALLPFGALRARVALAATTLAMLVGIAPAMHGAFGPPSPTLLALAVLQLAGRPRSPLDARAALAVLLLAGPLYAGTAGWLPFDAYALGYQPWPLLGALLVAGLALWRLGRDDWLLLIALGLAAYGGGLFANLWDALLDPLLALLAGAVLIRHGRARLEAANRR